MERSRLAADVGRRHEEHVHLLDERPIPGADVAAGGTFVEAIREPAGVAPIAAAAG